MPNVAYEMKYGKGPHVTVDVVLFDKFDRVILIQRKDGVWALPGGFVELNEKLSRAAERELKEETGISWWFQGPPVVYDDPQRDPRSHMITNVFVGTHQEEEVDYWGGDEDNYQPVAGDDAKDARWMPLKEAFKLSLYADHNVILVDAVIAQRVMDK